MELRGKKIHFLGDSITAGICTSAPDKMFVSFIAEECGAVCRNYGVGGTNIARRYEPSDIPEADRDFCLRMYEMEDDADVVVVFGGTNDYYHPEEPLGDMESRDVYTFYGGLHTLFLSLMEKYPEAVIAVITPLHRADEEYQAVINGKEEVVALRRYVEIIREVAGYYSLPLLDLYEESALQPSVPNLFEDYYAVDGIHPNDAGHRILADEIIRFLKTL